MMTPLSTMFPSVTRSLLRDNKEYMKFLSTGEEKLELPGLSLVSTVYPEYSECSECPEARGDYICSGHSMFLCKDCAESSLDIKQHSHHSRHSLRLVSTEVSGSEGSCSLCRDPLRLLGYHCLTCDFKLHPFCARKPPPFVIDNPKCHQHSLILMPRKVSFTCDACGVDDDRSPYVCSQCAFMVHKSCIHLPRIININRHDHRISRAYPLGPERCIDSICGVCRHRIDGDYGGYACSICPNFVVHSRCGIRRDVWDGIEHECLSEEDDSEDLKPFKVIDDKVINHFSHEIHNLTLVKDGVLRDESIRCRACIISVYADPFYTCLNCDDFMLHETCANLPRKKRHALHNHRLTLKVESEAEYGDFEGLFECSACERLSSGFKYECCDIKLDLVCASIQEPVMDRHSHPLYITTLDEKKTCGGCNSDTNLVFSCVDHCNYALDFKCATLPQLVRNKYDKHPLSLCLGDSTDDPYWCDVCEKRIDTKTWFYACDECGTTLHRDCVFKGLAYLKPGDTFKFMCSQFKVANNNCVSRPFCYQCKARCEGPIIVWNREYGNPKALCSDNCLLQRTSTILSDIQLQEYMLREYRFL